MNILPIWERCRKLPGGAFLFNQFLKYYVPYTGSLGARVVELRPGNVTVRLEQRRGVENHLNSVHAVALMNLCEVTSGLSVISAISSDIRAILVSFKIDYEKKARGTLIAHSEAVIPVIEGRTPLTVSVAITNTENHRVCHATATWLLERCQSPNGPKKLRSRINGKGGLPEVDASLGTAR